MGDSKHPGIQKALNDAEDHLDAYREVLTEAKRDKEVVELLVVQGKGDPARQYQNGMNESLLTLIMDVAVTVAHVHAAVSDLKKAVALMAEDMPGPKSRPRSIFDSRH